MGGRIRASKRSMAMAIAASGMILAAVLAFSDVPPHDSVSHPYEHLGSASAASDPRLMVRPSPVVAEVSRDTAVFTESSLKKGVGVISKGEKVTVLRDHRCLAYMINDGSRSGWVSADALTIPEDPPTNLHRMTTEEIEEYVNLLGLSSDTGFLLWVDIDRQLLHVMRLIDGRWRLDRTMLCSTGRNVSPTIRGTFRIEGRGEWFFSEIYKSGARNWVRFSGPYMIHSVTMDRYERIKDPTLGERKTAGCIRVSVDDSRWIYESIPDGTLIYIY